MAHDVFISYSSADKPTADAACATLESKGIRCWIAPRDILPGDNWGGAIVHAISGARAFVLVFSSKANKSGQIIREVERAVNRGIPVIPLRIENVMPTDSLEYFINTPHWLDAFHPPLEKHLNYLADVLQHILDGAQSPVPKPVPSPAKSLASSRNLVAGAAGLMLFGAVIWFAATYFLQNHARPTPPASPQHAASAQVAGLPPAPPDPVQGPYASIQGAGSMASILTQIGVSDLQRTRMTVSDVDGIYQVLGCEGLVDTRNFIYANKGLAVAAIKQLQISPRGYAIDTSALGPIERANVEAIQDYGKRAQCA